MKVACPNCKARIKVGAQHLGKKGRCPKCATAFRIPKAQPKAEPVEEEPAVSVEPTVVPAEKTNIVCPRCDNGFQVPVDWLGEMVTCSGCSSVIKAVRSDSPEPSSVNENAELENLNPLAQTDDWLLSADLQPAQLQPVRKKQSQPVHSNANTKTKAKKEKGGLPVNVLIASAGVLGGMVIVGLVGLIWLLRSGSDGDLQTANLGPTVSSADQQPANLKPADQNADPPSTRQQPSTRPEPEDSDPVATVSTSSRPQTKPAESPKKVVDTPKKVVNLSRFFPDWPTVDAELVPNVTLPDGQLAYGIRAGGKYGYHHDFTVSAPGYDAESKLACDVAFHVESQNVTGESDSAQRCFATGLGIPGNRVVVCTQLIQGADQIRVIKDGRSHDAEIVHAITDTPLTLLKVEGQLDFKPPRISPYDELERPVKLMRISQFGVLDFHGAGIEKIQSKSEFFDWGWVHQSWGGSGYRKWASGVAYDHRGQITGFVLPNAKQDPVICSAAGLAQAMIGEPGTIDTTSVSESLLLPDINNEVSQNLVQVVMDRPPQPSGFLNLEFDLEPKAGVNRLVAPSVFVPTRKGKLLGKLNFSASRGIEQSEATLKKQFPGLLGPLSDQSFVMLGDPGQTSWTVAREIQVFMSTGSGTLGIQKFVDADRVRSIGGTQTDQYVVLKVDENSATIRRRIEIVADNTDEIELPGRTLQLYGVSQIGLKGLSPVKMRAEQMIEFDLRAGVVTSSQTNGELKINPANNPVNLFAIELKTTAMSSGDLHQFVTRPPLHYVQPEPPLRSLKEAEAIYKTSITGSSTKRLRYVIPEPNEAISLSLASRIPKRSDTYYSVVAPLWILEKHIPLFVETWLKSPHFKSSLFVLKFVERHPPFDQAEELLVKSLKNPDTIVTVIRLLRTKYTGLSEKLLLPILEQINATERKKPRTNYYNAAPFLNPVNFRILWCLRDTGTSASLPVLETFREEFNLRMPDSDGKARYLESIDKTIETIEKRTDN